MAREAAKRRREMMNEISTTIDSTLTLIETILNKLELVRFDYRGLDDLKTELNLMQNLLRRAGFLRRSQSSVLFPFFERLRHFYFLIRSEERFVYEMVAEIAKFREVIEGFRLEFCEWNTSLLDAVLVKLPVDRGDSNEWRKLKLEMKLVKMFYQCAINGRDKGGNDFFLSDIKPGIDENAKQLYYCLVKLEASGKGVNPGLAESLCLFRKSLIASCEDTKVWVRDLYSSMSNLMLMSNTYPWLCSELVGFLEYLLECLRDVMDWGEASDPRINKSIGPLEKNLRFLKNIICFSTFWAEKLQISEGFLIHCQVSAIHAACLVYMFRFSSDDDCMLHDLLLGGSEILEKTKLGNDQVTQKYMETLMTSIQSRPSTSVLEVQEMHTLGNFVESLVDKLPELLDVRTSGMISLENTVWMLWEELELCNMFLKQKEKFNCLSQDEKNVLRELVYESAMVVFQMYTLEREERLVEEIRVRISRLAIKADPFNAMSGFVSKLSRQGTLLLEDDRVVGLDAEAEDLKNVLMTGSNPGGLGIVAIMGMAGVGKTTLAKKVYQDQVVISHFKFRAWCNVSQARSVGNMLIEILHCIAPRRSFRVSDDGELADILLNYLKRERYLVVLDNIWGSEAWNVLECCFPDQYNGSRILLTGVRNYPMINCHYTKTLGRLSDNTCFELLKQKLQCRNQGFLQFLPLWLVARLCRGLPSIVVTVGGILAESEEVEWKEIEASMRKFSHRPINEYLNFIMELGYQHLPDYLKPCLLYTAALPVGQEICVNKLLWLWLAEGFVKQNELKDLEDTAEDYIAALIRRNFVMVTKQGSTGKAKTCRIHDFVRNFCLMRSKDGNFLQLMGEDGDFSDFDKSRYLHRLFIYSQPKAFAESSIFPSWLNSLFHFKGFTQSGMSQLNSLLFHSKAANLSATAYTVSFSFRLKLLVVLDLEQINLGFVFPGEITSLVQLRFLAVLGLMKAVPGSIANLSNLETLLLTTQLSTNDQGDFSLPDSLLSMRNLKHLHVQGCLVSSSFVEGLGSTDYEFGLLTCSTLKVNDSSLEYIMRSFPRIRKLKLFLSSEYLLPSVVDLRFLRGLQSLKLNLETVDYGHRVRFCFPFRLKELTLQHFPWSMISAIEELPDLELLKLLQTNDQRSQRWEMVETKFESKFISHDLWKRWNPIFPNLKILKLKNSGIVRWESHEDNFPRLQSLVLEGCHQLQELPRSLKYTPMLELIKVQNCSVSVTDLVRGFEKDQKSRGNEGLKVLYLHS